MSKVIRNHNSLTTEYDCNIQLGDIKDGRRILFHRPQKLNHSWAEIKAETGRTSIKRFQRINKKASLDRRTLQAEILKWPPKRFCYSLSFCSLVSAVLRLTLYRAVLGLVGSIFVTRISRPYVRFFHQSSTAVANNCDDVPCPSDTREVTRGNSGICPIGNDLMI